MALIQHIQTIAPKTAVPPSTHIADTQTLSAIDHLKCPVCLEVLSEPVELPCRAVLCATCITSWLTISASSQCPCCYSQTPLDPVHINPASSLILDLLGDILVYCPICKLEVKAGAFHQHQCSPQSKKVDRDELQTTTSVIQQLLSQSPENVVELPTRGTVSHSNTHMHAYMHMHMHACTHMHTHTHTHTHTQTHT